MSTGFDIQGGKMLKVFLYWLELKCLSDKGRSREEYLFAARILLSLRPCAMAVPKDDHRRFQAGPSEATSPSVSQALS